jgi:hypothetical protein
MQTASGNGPLVTRQIVKSSCRWGLNEEWDPFFISTEGWFATVDAESLTPAKTILSKIKSQHVE